MTISICLNTRAQVFNFETDTISASTLVASSFISDSEGWIADNSGMLLHTHNAGLTWPVIPVEKKFEKLNYVNSFVGYGIASGALYKTENGGTSWSALILPGSASHAIYFFDQNIGLVSGNHVVYKTTNGGANWSTISTGVDFADYHFISAEVGFAASRDEDSIRCIWRTMDGGSSWVSVHNEESLYINSIWFTDENTGWAAGYYERIGRGKLPAIHQSHDGGLTWENVYLNQELVSVKGEALIDIHFRNELEGFALATYSQSVMTVNGGATWLFTHDEEGNEVIPDWGIYKSLDGFDTLYLMGRKGMVTKWD
jgi:photosystem II stability/assembly factor-like uncharacterized protein